MYKYLNIYSDGGSRGNPGLAAAGFVVLSENGQVVKSSSRFLGLRTNNQAEYEALISALEFVASVGVEEVICHLDSEVVTKHLTGEYNVKNAELRRLWNKVRILRANFNKISFVNVPRTNFFIQKADALVNAALDAAIE